MPFPGKGIGSKMQHSPPKFAGIEEITNLVSHLGDSFAVVENPPYIFPPYEVYPLAAPCTQLTSGMIAAVMDMDGTTTTTEVLCTGALESMVQRLSNRRPDTEKPILNHERDYPHIIGNSTTKHVEYLVNVYGNGFVPEAVCSSFIEACAWTLSHAIDQKRAQEAVNALQVQGIADLLNDPLFEQMCAQIKQDNTVVPTLSDTLSTAYLPQLRLETPADLTRIGIEIYYQRYHESLRHLETAAAASDSEQTRPIEPMPGIGIALAMLKGWLGKDVAALGDILASHLSDLGMCSSPAFSSGLAHLPRLGEYFAAHPVKLGLVTSSIAAEAAIVMQEVFRVLREEIARWPVPRERRDFLLEQFEDPLRVYDACITASDSSEIRLKPHRDLYAIALHTLGISPEQFQCVAGFEDSESGTIAIRAAGIPLCCALPFAMTKNHQFKAATQVCQGGIPEVILLKNFFLPIS